MPDSYWLRLGRRSEGPLSLDEMRRRATRGRLTPAHSVSRDGRSWMPARRCAEIFGEDGMPIPPGGAGPAGIDPLEGDVIGAWSEGSFGDPVAAVPAVAAVARPIPGVASWPAHLACALTLALACGLPMSRDAEGPLWWWHIVRLWDLGGGGLVTAAIAWGIVSVAAVATSVTVWLPSGPGRAIVLSASAVASMALSSAAWAAGMACGAWSVAACALIPVSAWAMVRSVERPKVPPRVVAGMRHAAGGGLVAYAALGGVCAILCIVAICVRDGAAGVACAMLMLVAGAGAIAEAIRWRVAGPDEWTTMIPCGVVAMAFGAMLCDALAAMSATPSPPSAGTRFAVLDAGRTIAVLLCQCALAYLAQRDHGAAPSATPALAPHPGMTST